MPDEETQPFNLLGANGFLLWSTVILLVVGLPFIFFVLGKASGVGIFRPAIHSCSFDQGGDDQEQDSIAPEGSAGQNKEANQKKGKGNDQKKQDRTCVHFIGLTWLAIISCAAFFGALGVMLSLVFRRQVDERLFKLSTPKILLVVYGVGSILAILLLALFIGKFVQGNLFPVFSTESWFGINFRMQDWAKLIIWSFIAGFSERLMPTLFDQLIERALPKNGNGKDQDKQPLSQPREG